MDFALKAEGAIAVKKTSWSLAAVVAVTMAFLVGTPARSGEAELGLLLSYIGDWRGEGVVQGGDTPDPFRCRLTIAKGNATKINYTGRCSLVDANISISGTIAYNDDAARYEAAMSSNAGFTGLAIGSQQSNRISFDLKEQQKDRSGSDVRIGSRIVLVENSISVDFEIEFNNSGQVLTASVPFTR
jgi:THAP4-like, heme-binding beta-barrel domain